MFDFWQGAEGLSISGFLIRAGIVYIYIFLLIKVLGQRSMTTMNPIDFLFGVIIGDVVGEPLSDGELPLAGPLSAAAFIAGIHLFLSYIALKTPRFRRIIEDEPIILMEKGIILHKEMSKAKVTVESLMMDLRLNNSIDLTEVDYAVLESNGQISAIKKSKYDSLTPDDVNKEIADKGYPTVLIQDGHYIDANIEKVKSRKWVDEQIQLHGFNHVKEIFLMTLDGAGKVYLSKKNPSM
ncbi:DUF421 domain-containing protein [Salipaludibacillus keqinensis]|uniref:DUF421 domain-containing protein n=1 Tax=Salipaludibacillus keqinensis TaxID=2045207 RepID=A0A323TNM3_9BACI|nr:DUF421 domain-containing protein [Salipaludibacillus keqinensis]PYZ95267.1 DUF421 domain-containing protein [Salipaludibacillus keqinensis]